MEDVRLALHREVMIYLLIYLFIGLLVMFLCDFLIVKVPQHFPYPDMSRKANMLNFILWPITVVSFTLSLFNVDKEDTHDRFLG